MILSIRIYGLLTSLILLVFCQTTTAQEQSVRINEVFTNQSLSDAVHQLEDKYDLHMAYDPLSLAGKNVSIELSDASLTEAMTLLLQDTDLKFRITNAREVLIRSSFRDFEASAKKMTLDGFVYDLQTLEPLAGAAVLIGQGRGTTSDQDGYFSVSYTTLEKPDSIQIRYLGYKTSQWSVSQLPREDKPVFYMNAQATMIPGVEIRDRIPMLTQSAADGSITLATDDLESLPSFVGGMDLLRSMQLLPGVMASDDLSSDLHIRGASSEGNLVVLDGITLFNTDHYLGIFSAVNPNVTGEVSLYKNDFPIEHGGRTAGLVDISTKDIRSEQSDIGVEFNLLTSNVWAELPVSNSMSFLIGGRITNTNIADTKLFDPLDQNMRDPFLRNNPNNPNIVNRVQPLEPAFTFNDINAKWQWALSPKTRLRASLFHSHDQLDYTSRQDFITRVMNVPIVNRQTHQEVFIWENNGWSSRLDHDWLNGFQSSLLVSQSKYNSENEVTTLFEKKRPLKTDSVRFGNRRLNDINAWNINSKHSWTINPTSTIHVGYQWNRYEIQTQIRVDNNPVLNQDFTANVHTGYLQYVFQKQKWQIRLGSRLSNYRVTQDWYLSPRMGFSYWVSDDLFFKGSFSRNYQFLRQLYHEDRYGRTYDFWVLANDKKFPVAQATNYMLGFNWANKSFSLDVEFFYKKTEGILEHAKILNGLQGPDDAGGNTPPYAVFEGTGLTKGMDVLLKKSAGRYTGWLSYTLSKTTHEYPGINAGNPFPGQYDRRHQLQWVNQYRYKDWQFSLTYVFASGRPYSDLSSILGLRDRRITDPDERIRYLPDYHRVDIGVNYYFNPWGKKARLGFSVFNLFDRQNVKYVQYTFSVDPLDSNTYPAKNTVVGTELDMLGITPNVSFSIEF